MSDYGIGEPFDDCDPVLAIDAIVDEQTRLGLSEDAAWARWESQPRLLVASSAAKDWLDRFGEHAPITFDGTEGELVQSLEDAIESARTGKVRDEFYIVVQGIRLVPADLHERQVASLRESNRVYREQCAKLAGQLDGAMRVGEGAALAVTALSADVRDMEARIDELTAVLQRIADLAQIGEKLPTAANFRNIRQHTEQAAITRRADGAIGE